MVSAGAVPPGLQAPGAVERPAAVHVAHAAAEQAGQGDEAGRLPGELALRRAVVLGRLGLALLAFRAGCHDASLR